MKEYDGGRTVERGCSRLSRMEEWDGRRGADCERGWIAIVHMERIEHINKQPLCLIMSTPPPLCSDGRAALAVVAAQKRCVLAGECFH